MTSYKADYGGIGDMLTSGFMKAEMLARAEKAKAVAEATAPVDSGDYVSSFSVSVEVQHHVTARAAGVLTNSSKHAIDVEYGGKNTPKHRTMLKAISTVGDGE